MRVKKIDKALVLFALGALLLTTIWFREGHIYGGGDVGLQTYNPQRIFEISRYIWWESVAPGLPVPQGLTSLSFNLIFSWLQFIGFNPLMLQATLFFLILFFMGSGMYIFLKYVIGNQQTSPLAKRNYALLGALFYIFNPYMMVQVWHRFVHSTFFLVAALPFLILFWLKWIREKRALYLFAFLIVNLLALYAYGTIAYILTIWLFIFLISGLEICVPWKGSKNGIQILVLFLIGFLFWFIVNLWWLIPIFKIAPGLFSVQHTNEESITTLINLGKQTVIPYLIQMINPFYVFYQLDLGRLYLNIFMRIIPLMFFAIIFIGIIKGLKIKEYSKWAIVYLLVLFLAKGAASPLGYLYIFGFENFFALGVLRNPFEKVGVILPFLSAIIFILGSKTIFDYLNNKKNDSFKRIFVSILVISILIFCYPMLNGAIFGRIDKPEFVQIPSSYPAADKWIASDYQNDKSFNPGNILHLPLTLNESILYNWQYGYSGLESSALFFTSAPSISHGFNIKQVDDVLKSLDRSLNGLSNNRQSSLGLIRKLNIRYIVLHKDVKWQESNLVDPTKTENYLNNLNFLLSVAQFDNLKIYKVKKEYSFPRIYLSQAYKIIYPSTASNSNLSFWDFLENSDTIQFDQDHPNWKDDLSTGRIILPGSSLVYPNNSKTEIEQLLNSLVSNSTFKGQYFESFNKARETLRQNGELKAVYKLDQIISSDKKIINLLTNMIRGVKVENTDIDDYKKDLQSIFSSRLTDSRLSQYIDNSNLDRIFNPHLYILNLILKKGSDEIKNNVKGTEDFLREGMIKNNIIPEYPLTDDLKGGIYKFMVEQDGEYELMVPYIEGSDKNGYGNIKIALEGKTVDTSPSLNNGLLAFDKIFLSKGTHEIYITKILAEKPFLSLSHEVENVDQSSITFRQNNPVDYTGHLMIKKPSILIFAQTFHPGWVLTLHNQNKSFKVSRHFISNFFGNAFYIDETGEYDFNLAYSPQKIVNYGIILSAAICISFLLYIFIFEGRRR